MGRRKIDSNTKNKNVSVSLPFQQIQFLNNHPTFNLSRFLQLSLDEYINDAIALENLEKEEKVRVKDIVL